jgi:hypothetical protein
MIDSTTPPTRLEMLDYLWSHPEYEHIEMDMKEKYNTVYLCELTDSQLLTLSEQYDYFIDDLSPIEEIQSILDNIDNDDDNLDILMNAMEYYC